MLVNNVTLIGRLTKDLELKKTNSGASVLSFTLAVDRFKEGTDFIQCQAWKQSAEYLYQYAQKGALIGLNGHISTRNYEGQNGKVYVTEVIAKSVKILQSKSEPKLTPQSEPKRETRTYQPTLTQDGKDLTGFSVNDIQPDDLPFY